MQIECNVDKADREPKDLLKMGDVTKLEYEIMALYKKKTGKEPKENKK